MGNQQMYTKDAPPKKSCGQKLGDCCNESKSICCTIFSLWGVLTLCVIGILLEFKYRPIDGYEIPYDNLHQTAITCFIAAGIYGGIALLCLFRLACIKCCCKPRHVDVH